MPRVAILKASTAARRAIPHERCFDLSKQPTVIERVAARIFEIIMNCGQEAAVINVYDDIVEPITERAPIFKDKNGKRLEQTILQALARLAANGYIEYCIHRDNIERFRITPEFQAIIQELIEKLTTICANVQHYNAVEHHRFNCCFFRTKFRRNFKRTPTRRDLDLENRRLIFQAKEHSRVCPMSQTRSLSVATEATEIFDQEPNPQNTAGPSGSNNHREDRDSMYVDDVPRAEPVASGSGLQPPRTPVRPSHRLNSVGAYPSPESLERTVSVAPLTPEQTPTRSRSVTTAGADDDGLGDVDMDVDALGDDPPRMSNNLFNRDVSERPRTGSHLETEHEEKIEAMRIECDERLRVKDIECDARLAAERVDFEEEIAVKSRENESLLETNRGLKEDNERMQEELKTADDNFQRLQEGHDQLKQENTRFRRWFGEVSGPFHLFNGLFNNSPFS